MDDKPYYLIGDVDIHNMDEYKIYWADGTFVDEYWA